MEKETFRALGIATAPFARGRRSHVARRRGRRRSGCLAVLEDAARRLRRQGASGPAILRRCRPGVGAARRGPAHPRRVRAVPARAVDRRRARPRRRGGVLAGGREHPRRDGILRRTRARARNLDAAGCKRGRGAASGRCSTPSTTWAWRASSCSTSTGSCSPTRWRPGSTTVVTGPSRARSRASSRTTCARCSAGRWARPQHAARARWSTASASCRHATRCSRSHARTSTTTASHPDPVASSGTSPWWRPTPANSKTVRATRAERSWSTAPAPTRSVTRGRAVRRSPRPRAASSRRRRRVPSRSTPRRCAGPATAPNAAPHRPCARSAARAPAAEHRRAR